jgi:hypothetical protein
MKKPERPAATQKPKVRRPATAQPANAVATRIIRAVQAGACKISAAYQVKASDMPVTINLCSDTTGTLATAMDFDAVEVYDSSGVPVAGQPTTLKSNSFVLNLKTGTYDISSTLKPGEGAGIGPKPTLYLYENCKNATTQLCAFITSVSPQAGFHLSVI